MILSAIYNFDGSRGKLPVLYVPLTFEPSFEHVHGIGAHLAQHLINPIERDALPKGRSQAAAMSACALGFRNSLMLRTILVSSDPMCFTRLPDKAIRFAPS